MTHHIPDRWSFGFDVNVAGNAMGGCLWTDTVHDPIQATPEPYARYTDERDADGAFIEPDMPTRYRAMVEGMDRAVGRVLDALDALEFTV